MSADQLGHVGETGPEIVPKPRRRIRPLTADAQAWQADRAEFSARLAALSIKAERCRRLLFVALPGAAVAGFVLGWLL